MFRNLQLQRAALPGLSRAARAVVRQAAARVARWPADSEAVHETRLSIKRLRALLNLLRPSETAPRCRALEKQLRDAARSLSAARDTQVVHATFRKLLRREDATALTELTEFMELQSSESAAVPPEAVEIALREALTQMRRVVGELADLRFERSGWPLLACGLELSYAGARRAARQAERKPKPERFHELRKRVKCVLYQLEILQSLWPDALERQRDQLHRLGTLLGALNDLALVEEAVRALVVPGDHGASRKAALKWLRSRRQKLARRALKLSGNCLDQRAKAWLYDLKPPRSGPRD